MPKPRGQGRTSGAPPRRAGPGERGRAAGAGAHPRLSDRPAPKGSAGSGALAPQLSPEARRPRSQAREGAALSEEQSFQSRRKRRKQGPRGVGGPARDPLPPCFHLAGAQTAAPLGSSAQLVQGRLQSVGVLLEANEEGCGLLAAASPRPE